MKNNKYYIGLDYGQFNKLSSYLRGKGLQYISDAKTANQSEYTILISLSDEDLLALKLANATQWIRKANW